MQGRRYSVDGPVLPARFDAATSSRNPFRVDSWLGHAWFARSEEMQPRREPRQTLPVLRRAELILAGKGRAVARRPTRIPADAIVGIGAKFSPLQGPEDRKGRAKVANDNKRHVSPRLRTVLREVFFLLLFGATLAGTYYVGRMHAFQNVIVVPDTPAKGHRVV